MAAKLLLQGSVNPLRTKLSAIIEDYAAVFSGIAEAAQERPYLALFKFSLATAVGAMMMSNPDEEQYEGSLVEASDAIGVLSIHERNKVAANYVRDTLDAYRSGHVRYVNLFVCSVLVRQEYPTKVRGGANTKIGGRGVMCARASCAWFWGLARRSHDGMQACMFVLPLSPLAAHHRQLVAHTRSSNPSARSTGHSESGSRACPTRLWRWAFGSGSGCWKRK
jgi:hypothetical protein